MRRHGFTIVESTVAACLFAVILGALLFTFSGGSKSADAARSTGALAGALTLSERLLEDVRQMAYDPASPTDLVAGTRGISFYTVAFVGPETVLRRVRYVVVPEKGALVIARTAETTAGMKTERFGNLPLRSGAFTLITDQHFGGRSLRLDLVAIGDDRPGAAPSARDVPHSVLARLPMAPAWGDPQRDPARRVRNSGPLLSLDE